MSWSPQKDRVKYYVADAGEKGLGGFVGAPQKKGDKLLRKTETNELHFPKEAWLTFYNSKLTDLCKGFCDAVLTYSYWVSDLDVLVMFMDSNRFINHSDDANLISISGDWEEFNRDLEAGSEILCNYRDPGVCYPCPWAKFLWARIAYGNDS